MKKYQGVVQKVLIISHEKTSGRSAEGNHILS